MSLCRLCVFTAMMQIIYSFVQKDSLYFTIARKSVESHLEELSLKTFDTITKIIKVGDDVSAGCNLCDINLLQWTYKGPNKPQEEIVTSGKAIRTKYQGKNTSWFELVNYSNCRFKLHLPKIQYDAAGIYTCWDNLNKISTTNIVVINDNNNCSSEPEFSDSDNTFLTQKISFTIKCSFKYAADESCVVAPIWTDLTGYRNLNLPGDDFEVDMDNLQAWIHFKSGADILNGTHLNLSFAFSCSFSNNSQDKYEVQSSRLDYGQVPFTLFVEVEKVLGRREIEINSFRFIVTLSSCTVLVMFLSALAVLLICLKNHSKLCFANRANKETIELGNDPSEKPKSGEYIGLREDWRTSISNVYDVINEETYEAIDDPEKPVEI